jgi:antitoxin (DNA-binding transcriptional repressor) of toxin-antitoxin stability system
MTTVNMLDAKTNLSKLVEAFAARSSMAIRSTDCWSRRP